LESIRDSFAGDCFRKRQSAAGLKVNVLWGCLSSNHNVSINATFESTRPLKFSKALGCSKVAMVRSSTTTVGLIYLLVRTISSVSNSYQRRSGMPWRGVCEMTRGESGSDCRRSLSPFRPRPPQFKCITVCIALSLACRHTVFQWKVLVSSGLLMDSGHRTTLHLPVYGPLHFCLPFGPQH
jgi:hypothetical protein